MGVPVAITRPEGMVVYILVVQRSTFFPLSQLMIHGVIVASHGDALHWGLNRFDAVDFTQEVWSFVVSWPEMMALLCQNKLAFLKGDPNNPRYSVDVSFCGL